EFPNEALSDAQIRELMRDFDNPADAREAIENFNNDLEEATKGGEISLGLEGILKFFAHLVPSFNPLEGDAVQQAISDITGGGVNVCPVSVDGKYCQRYIANQCDE